MQHASHFTTQRKPRATNWEVTLPLHTSRRKRGVTPRSHVRKAKLDPILPHMGPGTGGMGSCRSRRVLRMHRLSSLSTYMYDLRHSFRFVKFFTAMSRCHARTENGHTLARSIIENRNLGLYTTTMLKAREQSKARHRCGW